jgi:hypothetical protein
MITFPVTLRFKFFALASQIYVSDASGKQLLYVKQKLFKLKEHVMVYRDDSQQHLLYEIKADKMLDFSAKYTFWDATSGERIGHTARIGMRSIWRASYDTYDGDGNLLYSTQEENPFVKLIDGILEAIPLVGPILGIFQGMFLNPRYSIRDEHTQHQVFTLIKRKSITEGIFTLEPATEANPRAVEETGSLRDEQIELVLLSILMMALLEKNRG